ncbi:MAG: hypothetical protein WD595_05195 [Waddliaceae bacterium]
MQKGSNLEFKCLECEKAVFFSLVNVSRDTSVECFDCGKKYLFNDETLIRQLQKFQSLCEKIHECEEILGNTSVGIDVGKEQVKVPYKLLLTRLSSCLELKIGDKPLTIFFRFEPLEIR